MTHAVSLYIVMKKGLYLLILIIAAAFALQSCGETVDPEKEAEEMRRKSDPDYDAKVYLRTEYMDVYYYWNSEVKSRNREYVPYETKDIYEWFDKLLYAPKDRWSWMEDREGYLETSTGTISGTWGISLVQPAEHYKDYGIYVAYVLPGSPMEKHGVTRGAQLRAVGGVEIGDSIDSQEKLDGFNNHYYDNPNTFTFRLLNGIDTTFTVALAPSLKTDYILKTEVFTEKDFPGLKEPVGYIHYLQFVSGFIPELDAAMRKFKTAGVKKLIVDLRYNGGGDSAASDTLVSFLAPAGTAGLPYVTRTHNSNLSRLNKTQTISKNAANLGLDEVYFILMNGSASASEMVFNGLRPYYGKKIHHVGLQSYGKPNGMYVLMYPGDDKDYERYNNNNFNTLKYVFYPICYYNKNADGEEIPSDATAGSGFTPECECPDDVYHDFGPKESNIYLCLSHIANGSFPSVQVVRSNTKAAGGLENPLLLPEYRTNPQYGVYAEPAPRQ